MNLLFLLLLFSPQVIEQSLFLLYTLVTDGQAELVSKDLCILSAVIYLLLMPYGRSGKNKNKLCSMICGSEPKEEEKTLQGVTPQNEKLDMETKATWFPAFPHYNFRRGCDPLFVL